MCFVSLVATHANADIQFEDLCYRENYKDITALFKPKGGKKGLICHVRVTPKFHTYEEDFRECLQSANDADKDKPLEKIWDKTCNGWKVDSLENCLALPTARFHQKYNEAIADCEREGPGIVRRRDDSEEEFKGGNWGLGIARLHYTDHWYSGSANPSQRDPDGQTAMMFELHHYFLPPAWNVGYSLLGVGPFVAVGAKANEEGKYGVSLSSFGLGVMVGIKSYLEEDSNGINFGLGHFWSSTDVDVSSSDEEQAGNEMQSITRESRGIFLLVSTKW